ncbi:MAG: hypothetical protein P1U68_13595 [Verrucomicrobiales bacterium]|nr:hypothetical protein [Verrucomicrobiales bacterium]
MMKPLTLLAAALCLNAPVHGAEPADWLTAFQEVGLEGEGNSAAAAAWGELTQYPADTIPQILDAMKGASPLAANWMRSAAGAILEREKKAGATIPTDEFRQFLLNRENAPGARFLAYEFLDEIASDSAATLVPGMLDDPSPPLRRIAVAQVIEEAKLIINDQDAASKLLRTALDAARDVDQINEIASLLREDLKQEVDLPTQFGFLMRWHLIAPFDNTGREGFDAVYAPETNVDLTATYQGKDEKEIRWESYSTSNDYGMVDFNQPFSPLKEVVGYAHTEFESSTERQVELRLGCKNAWKVWLNGELIFGREEYHRGIRIDQYVLPVMLKAGKNSILVKACQNEQEQDWTVQWEFQLRVCDSTGAAVLSDDRLPTPEPEQKGRRRSAE